MLFLFLFLLPWPASAGVEPARNVLIVTLDTTRADRLSAYGGDGAAVPGLDRLFREGARFDRAYTVVDGGLTFLQEMDGSSRWFLWLHLFDPHAEYQSPEPFRCQYADSPYDGEVAYSDSQVSRVLDFLRERNWLDSTLVVVTSDRGESLGEHGEPTHGIFVYDATVRIPLLLRYPAGIPAGRAVDEVVRIIDIAPTVTELAGVDAGEAQFQGRSVMPLLDGRDDAPRTAWMESWAPRLLYGWSEIIAVRDADWKYIRAPRPELYSLEADPQEMQDLSQTDPQRANAYRARLDALEQELAPTESGAPGEEHQPDPQARRALESLGYLSTVAPGESGGPLPDPKDRVEDRGRTEQAVGFYERALERDPRLVRSVINLAVLYEAGGRTDDALQLYLRAIELEPENEKLFYSAAYLLFVDGEFADALDVLDQAKQAHPDSVQPAMHKAMVYEKMGNLDGAWRELREALELRPEMTAAQQKLQRIEEQQKNRQASVG